MGKLRARGLLVFYLFVFSFSAEAQTPVSLNQDYPVRSFYELFPNLEESRKNEVFREGGLVLTHEKNELLEIIPARNSGIMLPDTVMKTNPAYLTESLLLLPYSQKVLNRLDAYNALGKIRDLKGRVYHSFTKDSFIPLFEDATRLDSTRRTSAIPDPEPAKILPLSETVYIRLKDVNFGNSYYRGDVSVSPYGVTYNLTNYRNLTYLFFTVMKEEKFSAILYMEPLTEGMLVYSVAGADASDFIASKIDIPSAISKRLAVFIGWISDGLKTMM